MKTAASDSRRRRSAFVSGNRTGFFSLFGCLTPRAAEELPEKDVSDISRSNSRLRKYQKRDISEASTSGSDKKRSSTSLGMHSSSSSSSRSKDQGGLDFTMDEILKATKNFSPTFIIGQGGFATVYKGCLRGGTVVAIKRAKKVVNDKHLAMEFYGEVSILARIEHLNLVRFYGYLDHGDERILVVEYVPNGTLREHLDGMNGEVLDFTQRLEIAIDVAHAVTYLHMYTDHPVIHRDIKSSNILLTGNLRAKVADFGLARLGVDGESGDTHVSTLVKGTTGYVDPEYLTTNHLTEKSDVYSFGVLLVELLTGRRPIEPNRQLKERITIKWAMKKFSQGDSLFVLDPRVERSPATIFGLEKILELSLHCLAPHRNNRPSMRKCSEILWSIRKDYSELRKLQA